MATLITFDIDGTLLKFGGNSVNHPIAMKLAFNEMFNLNISDLPEKYVGKPVRGWTDYHLALEMFRKAGQKVTPESMLKYQKNAENKYLEISTIPPDLTPGVHELLSKLQKSQNIKLAIATGSYPRIAKKKLEQSQLMKYFKGFVGGFGDTFKRSDVILSALLNAEHVFDTQFLNKFHVGDTSTDAYSAHDCGFKSIVVKTGHQKHDFPIDSIILSDFIQGYDEFIKVVEKT